ncbi:MAG TPA: nuclear transport factor 2 family protein [Terriglobales bacterium]|nr:nuclear transport factor 2 family protein [Terriglobales bacterium]
MKRASVAVAAFFVIFASVATAQERQTSNSKLDTSSVETQVRKLWEAFQKKDKATLASLLDDHFRMFEEGLSTFADKKAEVKAVDEFELVKYTLSDFTVTPTGPNSAAVTYIAQYEGKSNGETSKAKSVFGEVWVHKNGAWKNLYLQETYMK